MALATVLNYFSGLNPNHEAVTLTATDGETYQCKKFQRIYAAGVMSNSNAQDGDVNVTFSGDTATLNLAGVTDKTVTLELFGRPTGGA